MGWRRAEAVRPILMIVFAALAVSWCFWYSPLITGVAAQGSAKPAPIFEVDPFWPRPLPNHWVTGSTIGISIDAQDNVWTIHRPGTVEDNLKAADVKVGGAPIGECCKVAPPVLIYGPAGNLIRSWDGPGSGYDWPDS